MKEKVIQEELLPSCQRSFEYCFFYYLGLKDKVNAQSIIRPTSKGKVLHDVQEYKV